MADSPSELQFEIETLERKHAENPEGRFFVPLANAYRKLGDVETAEALLRSGIQRHPDYLSAHIVLGRCLADSGAAREAEEEFRFVLSQDPQNLIALRTLGELAAADGRPAEAAEWYNELLAVDPMNEEARQALETLSSTPAAGELESEFRPGVGWWEVGDEQPDREDAGGEALAVEGEDEDASAPEFIESYAGGSSEVVTETIAELYARQGLHERAAGVYRELIRRRGGDPALERRLADIERQAAEDVAAAQDELPALTLEDDEALVSPALDAEPDPFADSFSDGFAAVYDDEPSTEAEEAPDDTTPPSWQDETDAGTGGQTAGMGGATIIDFLSSMARWRSGPTATPTTAGDAAIEEPAAPPETPAEPQLSDEYERLEPWTTPAEPPATGRGSWEAAEEDAAGQEVEDLPYLEEVGGSAPAAGTGSADDEPFPWELPGEGAADPSAENVTAEPDEIVLDPYFAGEVEHVEPASELGDTELPEVAPPTADSQGGPPSSAPDEPSDDEDLESFQAWLRSLKR